MNKKKVYLCLTSLLIGLSVQAQSDSHLTFKDFWIVAPPSVAAYTAGYGRIINTSSKDVELLSVTSKGINIMMHETMINLGLAKMVHKTSLIIKANSSLEFKPMSLHLMISNPSLEGRLDKSTIRLNFIFKNEGEIPLLVDVKQPW